MKRDYLTDPAWRPEDLGLALPDSPHAVSVAMPLWEHVVAYEEEDPAVIERLECGYPRFFCHPSVRRLFAVAEQRFADSRAGRGGERCLVFPSMEVVERAEAFVRGRGFEAAAIRCHEFGWGGLGVLALPAGALAAGLEFWRYAGAIVSSRQADAALSGEEERLRQGVEAAGVVRERLAGLSDTNPGDVFLFSTGMEATFTAHRLLREFRPDGKSLQLEFPYVDVLKVQTHFGAGERFVPVVRESDWAAISNWAAAGDLSGVFCELASNPLMRSVDLQRLRTVLEGVDTPLVIDDTVATVVNADVFQFADLVTTSLTKYFAGTGDVMAGAVIVNPDSPHAGFFRSRLARWGDSLWPGDAAMLEQASRDFAGRMDTVNRNGLALYELLRDHPRVERVYYPVGETPDFYEQIRRPRGGFGGLLSIELKDAPVRAPRFYDHLRVCKGPSFGTRFTLACPYTLLAHYHDLDWAESCGVSRWLVRVGVGLEDGGDLVRRFEPALEV